MFTNNFIAVVLDSIIKNDVFNSVLHKVDHSSGVDRCNKAFTSPRKRNASPSEDEKLIYYTCH